ncbi:MAG: S8 family serine peptidase [archaeon]
MKRSTIILLFLISLVFSAFMLAADAKPYQKEKIHITTDVQNFAKQNEKIDVIVMLKEGKSIKENELSNDFKVNSRIKRINSFSATITKEDFEYLSNNINIDSISLDYPLQIMLQDSVPLINASITTPIVINGINITGNGQTVCILDTGINYSHSDFGNCFGNGTNLSCKVIDGYDFINNDTNPYDDHSLGHGTHVAGIVAANGSILGVAPGASIVALKVMDNLGGGTIDTLNLGLEWCLDNSEKYNITVFTASLGTNASLLWSTFCDDVVPSTTALINEAIAKDISVFFASGNYNNKSAISLPACIQNATAVGATTKSDAIASYSNRCNITDLFAPGGEGGVGDPAAINSTSKEGSYTGKSGTSMATPHAAGAALLLRQFKLLENSRNMTAYEVQNALNMTGKRIPDSPSGQNYSRINVYAAVLSIESTKPNLTMEYPQNITYYTVVIPINFTAEDNLNLTQCTYSIDSQENITIPYCSNYSFTASSAGSHNFTLYAIDAAGNFNSSSVIFNVNYDFNISECRNITVSGRYVMNTSINNWSSAGGPTEPSCMNITVSDVELDCGGWENWIEGRSVLDTYGIRTGGGKLNNISIKNCNLSYFWGGVYLISVENSTLTNLTLDSNWNGVYLSSSSYNNITHITCSNSTNIAFRVRSSSNSNIIQYVNSSNNPDEAFYIDDSSNNTIKDIISSWNLGNGAVFDSGSNFNTLTNITVLNNRLNGIRLDQGANHNTIANCTVSHNNGGIYIRGGNYNLGGNYSWGASYNNITGCTIQNNSVPGLAEIYIRSNVSDPTLNSSYNRIWNNIINGTSNGGKNAFSYGENYTNYFNITKTVGTNIIGGSWIAGNYWSDYYQNDTSGDYIGDTDYIINETYMRDLAVLVYSSNYTTPPIPVSSNSGGGGGSGGTPPKKYELGVFDADKEYSKVLKKKESIKFIIFGKNYSISLNSILKDKVNIEFSSITDGENMSLSLLPNSSILINITGMKNEISIMLNEMSYILANLTVRGITASAIKETEIINKTEEAAKQQQSIEQKMQIEARENNNKAISAYLISWVALFLIIVFLAIFIIVRLTLEEQRIDEINK